MSAVTGHAGPKQCPDCGRDHPDLPCPPGLPRRVFVVQVGSAACEVDSAGLAPLLLALPEGAPHLVSWREGDPARVAGPVTVAAAVLIREALALAARRAKDATGTPPAEPMLSAVQTPPRPHWPVESPKTASQIDALDARRRP